MRELFKKILITGSTGSIGREFPKSIGKLTVRMEESEIQMLMKIRRAKILPKIIIHLAGMVATNDCEKNPKKTYRVNVDGAVKLMRAGKLSGVKEFIYISTSHVYRGVKSYSAKINISFPKKPNSVYGKTKFIAEKKLRELSKNPGYPKLTIVRVFSVNSSLSRKGFLTHNLRVRKENMDYSPIPGLKIARDFLTAKEISKKIIMIAGACNKKEIYLVCSGKATTVEELAYRILEIDKKKIQLKEKPSTVPSNWNSLVGYPTII